MSVPYTALLIGEVALLGLALDPLVRLQRADAPPFSLLRYPAAVAFAALSNRASRDSIYAACFAGWLLTAVFAVAFLAPEALEWARRLRTWRRQAKDPRVRAKAGGAYGLGWMVTWAVFNLLKVFLISLMVYFLGLVIPATASLANEASFQSPSFSADLPNEYPLNNPVALAVALSAATEDLRSALTATSLWLGLSVLETLVACFLLGRLTR